MSHNDFTPFLNMPAAERGRGRERTINQNSNNSNLKIIKKIKIITDLEQYRFVARRKYRQTKTVV